jgi:hypothetical protein
MKIGNNIHTTSNKKAYRKPVLEVVEMDRILLLAPGYSDPVIGGGGDTIGGTTVQSFPGTTFPTQPDYKKENPFGGGTPTYQR